MPQKAERTFLREQVYIAIRDAIGDGILEPGERLREDEIVEWLGSSRASIRDALARLSDQGLVEMVPNQYTRVAPVEPKDVVDSVVTQLVLFRIAITEGTPHLTEQSRQALQGLIDGVEGALREDSAPSAYLPRLGEYMRTLARAADNEMLEHYIDQAGPLVTRAMNIPGTQVNLPRLVEYFARAHREVMRGDVDRAVDIVREFVEVVARDLQPTEA